MANLRQLFIDESGQERIRFNVNISGQPNFVQIVDGRFNATDPSDSSNLYLGGYGAGIVRNAITSTAGNILFTDYTSASIGILAKSLVISNTIATSFPTQGIKIADAHDIELGTTTGTQIGTATSQKLAFYGITPVVQPTAYTPSNVTPTKSFDADTVDVATLADVVGTLIADLQALGLVG